MKRIMIAGDFYRNTNVCNIQHQVQSFIKKHSHIVMNLEGPLLKRGKNYQAEKKSGPNLFMYSDAINIMKMPNQFIIAGLANNHMGDFGEAGVLSTMDELDDQGVHYVGTGYENDPQIGLFEEDKFAVVNIAESESGICQVTKIGVCPINISRLYRQITELKMRKKIVIIYYHGGNEYCNLPNPFVRKLARLLIDFGSDLFVGVHSHCVQAFETYKDKKIFYGLGNFIFDSTSPTIPIKRRLKNFMKTIIRRTLKDKHRADIGLVLSVSIVEENAEIDIRPTVYNERGLSFLTSEALAHFQASMSDINEILADDYLYDLHWGSWVISQEKSIKRVLEGFNYNNLYVGKNYFPFQNYLRCESHLALVQKYNEIISSRERERYKSVTALHVDWKNL